MNAQNYKVYAKNNKGGSVGLKIIEDNDTFDFDSFLKVFNAAQAHLKERIFDEIKAWKNSLMKHTLKSSQVRLEKSYNDRINLVVSCFEFEIVEPDAFIFSSKGNPNYRLCRYGEKDDFRNCIWIHTHQLPEIVIELFKYNEEFSSIMDETNQYIGLINIYYENATGRTHFGS